MHSVWNPFQARNTPDFPNFQNVEIVLKNLHILEKGQFLIFH